MSITKPKQLVGQKAPEFTLPNHDGSTYTFTPGASGRPTAIFFYPESGTSGCTAEACTFRDALSEEAFKSTRVEIVGISPDGVEKQAKFVKDNKLNFPVLSDEKGDVRKAYGVGKGLFGLTKAGRITFVIDADGTVKDFFESTIKFKAHHKFVQDWLKTYPAAAATATASEPATEATTAAPAAPATEPTPDAVPAAEPAKEEAPEPKTAEAPSEDKPATEAAATEPAPENAPSAVETSDTVPAVVTEPAAALAPTPAIAPATQAPAIA
ncbi:AhpC-TSA-domain-containing protein [Schizopora paradoxa]|uniref:thioredoxin-dependent peroxiredoxin n=1 Tax=Schizopora paradoxa TaxID=27342 RepID=A0A0H2RKS2_9AGAM|nr:AhpC-TSA-domain-containing protein [Schizopora paradoxa]